MIKNKKKKAVFTIVRNESKLLPMWYNYYSTQYAKSDIYVLDHGSIDGCTNGMNAKFLNHDITQDFTWLQKVTSDYQNKLLESYESVLFTNVDEFICANPEKYENLSDFLARNKNDVFRCHGYEVLHFYKEEADLDLTKKPLGQRSWWYRNDQVYGKPLLSRRSFKWTAGWHRIEHNEDVEINEDLRLIHLHRVDYKMCFEKHKQSQKEKIHQGDAEKKWGWHLYVDDDDFEKWFYSIDAARTLFAPKSYDLFLQSKLLNSGSLILDAKQKCERIPDAWKSVM